MAYFFIGSGFNDHLISIAFIILFSSAWFLWCCLGFQWSLRWQKQLSQVWLTGASRWGEEFSAQRDEECLLVQATCCGGILLAIGVACHLLWKEVSGSVWEAYCFLVRRFLWQDPPPPSTNLASERGQFSLSPSLPISVPVILVVRLPRKTWYFFWQELNFSFLA